MSVTPTAQAISSSVNVLTLKAGSTGGVAAATTIDPVADYVLIYTNSAGATQGINRNTFLALSSAPLGLTDVQSPSNKTFNNTNALTIKAANLTIQDGTDTTKQAQFIASGITTGTIRSYTLPNVSGTLATLGGTQTFNGAITFTSATLTSPTITDASITADAITGFTTANTGSIYGVSVTNGLIVLPSNSVQASQLATNAITLGYAQITSPFTGVTSTSGVQVTGLTVTVTIPAGGRRVKITASCNGTYSTTGASAALLQIWDGVVGSGTMIGRAESVAAAVSQPQSTTAMASVVPAAGSKTYNIGLATGNASDPANIDAATTYPAFILVELI